MGRLATLAVQQMPLASCTRKTQLKTKDRYKDLWEFQTVKMAYLVQGRLVFMTDFSFFHFSLPMRLPRKNPRGVTRGCDTSFQRSVVGEPLYFESYTSCTTTVRLFPQRDGYIMKQLRVIQV